MRWRLSGRPASESVHRTTLDTLGEQNRRHVAPIIPFDRPRQEPPLLTFIRFLVGPFMQ